MPVACLPSQAPSAFAPASPPESFPKMAATRATFIARHRRHQALPHSAPASTLSYASGLELSQAAQACPTLADFPAARRGVHGVGVQHNRQHPAEFKLVLRGQSKQCAINPGEGIIEQVLTTCFGKAHTVQRTVASDHNEPLPLKRPETSLGRPDVGIERAGDLPRRTPLSSTGMKPTQGNPLSRSQALQHTIAQRAPRKQFQKMGGRAMRVFHE
jgi:hypothetical protein